MSQHDYSIANDTGANVRADINNALGAIHSMNSGGTAPSTTTAYMFWFDTGNDLLKQRNSADDAWVTIWEIDQTNDYAIPYLGGQKYQTFYFGLKNNGGTLEHRIAAAGNPGIDADFADKVSNATKTFTASPTGTDASTAFAAGGKISTLNSNAFIFDVTAQTSSKSSTHAVVANDDTGNDLDCWARLISSDVNGATVNRLQFFFYNGASAFALTTGNIGAGEEIRVLFNGFLS